MIRVLVVDDSAFMRKALSMMMESDPDIRVIDTARDGREALEKIKRLQPDIVTLDVEMPRMDGLTALRRIMKEAPRPVLMVSSLTKDGADTTVEALQAGAVDFIPKHSSYVSLEITKIKDDLIAKVKSISRSRSRLLRRPRTTTPAPPSPKSKPPSLSFRRARLIVIGVSTGGPFALQEVVPALPGDLPTPVVIVQHMPPHFTRSLADRLNSSSTLEVVEAEQGTRIEPGRVVIAPGGKHLTFRHASTGVSAVISEDPADVLHRPSADVTFTSASEIYRGRVLGLVMTGMGKDGLEGATRIKRDGGLLIAQDEATCVVYGMPRAVVEAGLADAVLPLDKLGPTLADAVSRSPSARTSPPVSS